MAKKPAAKPAAAKTKPTPAAVKPIAAAFNKSALLAHIADQSGVSRADVRKVFGALEGAIVGSLHKKGVGHITLPGLVKIMAVKVPAKPARKGINPFTKQEQLFAAKPASTKVKVRALAALRKAAA